MAGSSTIAAIEGYGLASPTPSFFAIVAVVAAFFWLGLQTPRTSASRTPTNPSRWNLALKPLPTIPMPKRVATIVEIGHADLAGPESRRRHVAEHVEEGDPLAQLRLRFLGPGDVVEHR